VSGVGGMRKNAEHLRDERRALERASIVSKTGWPDRRGDEFRLRYFQPAADLTKHVTAELDKIVRDVEDGLRSLG
jgi:hypothetical protein